MLTLRLTDHPPGCLDRLTLDAASLSPNEYDFIDHILSFINIILLVRERAQAYINQKTIIMSKLIRQ
jgi:hypothetical protein